MTRTCCECQGPVKAAGLCSRHYARQWAAKNPERMAEIRRRGFRRECSACHRPCRGTQWCRSCAPLYQKRKGAGHGWRWERTENDGYFQELGGLTLTVTRAHPVYIWRVYRNTTILVGRGEMTTKNSAKKAAERAARRSMQKRKVSA